jgi:hypothetical protein
MAGRASIPSGAEVRCHKVFLGRVVEDHVCHQTAVPSAEPTGRSGADGLGRATWASHIGQRPDTPTLGHLGQGLVGRPRRSTAVLRGLLQDVEVELADLLLEPLDLFVLERLPRSRPRSVRIFGWLPGPRLPLQDSGPGQPGASSSSVAGGRRTPTSTTASSLPRRSP